MNMYKKKQDMMATGKGFQAMQAEQPIEECGAPEKTEEDLQPELPEQPIEESQEE